MNFGKKASVESLSLEKSLPDMLYGENSKDSHHQLLTDIYNIFNDSILSLDRDFTCFIEKKAMDAFITFANEVYNTTHNEATGIIVGYYLHSPTNPEKKIIVATNFLQATGSASSVTCEFSYEDSIRHSKYCDVHHTLPIVWIHSHPGFGVFYSSTDSSTLLNYFACHHQVGVVVDNLQDKYMGFKIYNGVQCNEDIYEFNIENCLKEKKLIYSRLSEEVKTDSDISKKKSPISFKHLTETTHTPTTNKGNSSISFQLLQKLSSQLTIIEKDNSVERLKKCIEELSAFIKELKYTAATENNSGEKYTTEDIKAELSLQINDAIKNINTIFESLKTEFATFNSLEDRIEELRKDVIALKNEMAKNNEKPADMLANIEQEFPLIKSGRKNKKFLETYRNEFNIRELIWVLIVIAFIIKLIFFNHICE